MSELGLGIGIGNFPAGVAGGGGGSGPDPSSLSDLLIQVSAGGSFPGAEAAHTPGTPYQITETMGNLAAGGATFTHDNAVRPYYHTAAWTLDNAEVIPSPNGQPFWSSNAGGGRGDSGLTTQNDYTMSLSTRTASSAEYSGLSVMYYQGTWGIGRMMFRDAAGTDNFASVANSEDGYVTIKDTTGGPTPIVDAQGNINMLQWIIYTWRHSATGGSNCAYNGTRRTVTGGTGLTGTMSFDKFMPYGHYTTPITEVVLWNKAHTMEELDTLAAEYAVKYGITYTVSGP